MTNEQKQKLEHLVRLYPSLFANPNEKLTYTTNVRAEIGTNTDSPVYSNFYQFPMWLKDKLNWQFCMTD